MSARIPCCVPFCRRTFKCEDAGVRWVICGKHWRLADKSLRRRRTRLVRRYNRTSDLQMLERLYRMICTLDERGKRQAIERAAGL